MDILQKIFDLPVIAQGALGSFLFWISYEICKYLINFSINHVSGLSKALSKEYLLLEKAQLIQDKLHVSTNELTVATIACLNVAAYRFIQAAIYMCFGLIAREFIGNFSVFAYIFSITYLFRALKAAHIEISSSRTKDQTEFRLQEIDRRLDVINKNI